MTGDVAYFCGLDLGQSRDYTAFTVLERHGPEARSADFHVRHLERFPLGTSYPDIVEAIGERFRLAPLTGRREGRRDGMPTLAVDQTGVGAPVVDMFTRARLPVRLRAIQITGGDTVSTEGITARVPKRDLVSVVQIHLQTGRLRIAPSLAEAETLTRELQGFQVKISDAAHDSYGAWREGAHDDLVLALALALWTGSVGAPPRLRCLTLY